MERGAVFRLKSGYVVLVWFMLLLLILSMVVVPFRIATHEQPYANLNLLLICYSVAGLLWIVAVIEFGQKTLFIELAETEFAVKKIGQKTSRHSCMDVLAHNERLESGRGGSFNELTIYLTDNWFAIRSNEFADYDYLKNYFTQYGQPVAHRTVFTLTERNRLRWLIIGLALLIAINIAFGYVAHNPADPNPAQLITLIDTVDKIRQNRNKSRLTGVTISLRAFPDFAFYVSRRHYDVQLDALKSVITPKRPISLLIRQSDYRKKLRRIEPLTFGDKYDNYRQIPVYGVTQDDSVRILTPGPVYEPTHTRPHLRAFLFSILLLLCWTGWVYVDRQPVLRANGV